MIKIPEILKDKRMFTYVDGACEKYGINYLPTEDGWKNPDAISALKSMLADDQPYESYAQEMFDKIQADRLYGGV